jgi:uncharacterized protein (DUF4415 family)
MNKQIASEDRYTDAPPEIEEAIRDSEIVADDFPSPEELKRELKRTITIRLDPDVYAWFQLPGAGYQTRINLVLRRYMELQKAARSSKHPPVVAAVPRKAAKKNNPHARKKAHGAKAKQGRTARA